MGNNVQANFYLWSTLNRRHGYLLLIVSFLVFTPITVLADQLLLSLGTGSQPDSKQHNDLFAVDYEFYEHVRSPRSRLSVGVSYTRLTTDAATNTSITAVSIYPQLTLTPVRESLRNTFFFVRALGPSYMSSNALGNREQDNHFAFQAQVGAGYKKDLNNGNSLLFQTSWKHFSNANLFNDNDGIDIPFVFTIGYSF